LPSTDSTDARLPLDRAALAGAPATLLRDGRWANAQVFRVEAAGRAWVVKDFSRRALWVRCTIGRFLLRRELRALQRLDGIDGVPQRAFRIDRDAIAAEFIPGTTLGQVAAEQMTTPFFIALERLLADVHARGIVHLDTRGTGNMLLRPDGRPALIDFQASLDTRWMPASWRRWLGDLDMTGVYKKWLQRDPDSMGPARRELYERMTRQRRLWIARGYAGTAKQKTTSGHTGPH
jgi:predicted Ser/Thr protein kinase